jgi:hypothetical protein
VQPCTNSKTSKVILAHLVRFLVVKLIHIYLNFRSSQLSVLYLRLIIFLVGGDISIDNDIFLVIDFMNLKIKSTQFFGCAFKDSVYIYVYSDDCPYI